MSTVESYAMHLGTKIKEVREAKEIGLRELARLTGMSHGHLSEIEHGVSEPSVSRLQRIADALRVPITRLLPPREILRKCS